MTVGADPEASTFLTAFTEWVEACWFSERDAADHRLDAVLGFPADVVLVNAMAVLGRLTVAFAPATADEVAGALAQHLVVRRPDPAREALIRDVVAAAAGPSGGRLAVVRLHGGEAVTRAALECASFLAQVAADREGVVPSSILRGL